MILNGLSASIHSRGEQLPEYQTNEVDDNTIECWIPSTEGVNFEISYKVLSNNAQPNLAVRCRPQLDGVDYQGNIMVSQRIALGMSGECRGQVTGASSIRLFAFGKRLLTDREDVAPSKGSSHKDLNTIRATLQWGTAGTSIPQTHFEAPKENGPIHEKAAKKGHAGAAGLGNSSSLVNKPMQVTFFRPVDDRKSLVFVFHYAPEDWLQARGIIPSRNPTSKKRDRDSSPDVIDIDELESDDDDVIIVKHMAPVPSAMVAKRRKIKAEDDIKPELESGLSLLFIGNQFVIYAGSQQSLFIVPSRVKLEIVKRRAA
ncbi:hypothetical protein FRC07_004626 [Ceratobasidium sp. 392]|nr:hypothetical protein FRC07_004626 [Ceratobasidium sp. 392]